MAIETESYIVSWPHPKMETPPSSDYALNASFSHTPRWDPCSIISKLLNSLADLVEEESFAENATGMAAYTTMLCYFSTQPTTLATTLRSMLEELTRISNQYDGLLERHTTMCERMETCSFATSVMTISTVLGQIRAVRGATSSLHQTSQLFSRRCAAWIHELSCVHLQASRNMPSGHTERSSQNMSHQSPGLTVMSPSSLNSRDGTLRMLQSEDQEVGEFS